MSGFNLPHEGLTLEAIAKPIRATALQPLVTAALLLGSYQRPAPYEHVLSKIAKVFGSRLRSSSESLGIFRKTLAALVAAGTLYRLNGLFSRLVLNNWTTDRSWDWRREIVLVTGGCSGIGELIVQKLAKCGVQVVVFDVSEPRKQFGPTVTFYKVDITSSEAIREAAEKVQQDVGHPTVLVNNAGIGVNKTILDASEDAIRGTFNVNIVAHFLLVREFLPHMVKHNHGHVVTIASMASYIVHAGNTAYSCTKAAALAFHEGLAQELKSRYGAGKVRTTVIHPTWVRTPLIEKTLLQKKEFREFVLNPQTIADAVVSQLYKGESAQLILPGRLTGMSSVRGWPSWLQEGLRNSIAGLLVNA